MKICIWLWYLWCFTQTQQQRMSEIRNSAHMCAPEFNYVYFVFHLQNNLIACLLPVRSWTYFQAFKHVARCQNHSRTSSILPFPPAKQFNDNRSSPKHTTQTPTHTINAHSMSAPVKRGHERTTYYIAQHIRHKLFNLSDIARLFFNIPMYISWYATRVCTLACVSRTKHVQHRHRN